MFVLVFLRFSAVFLSSPGAHVRAAQQEENRKFAALPLIFNSLSHRATSSFYALGSWLKSGFFARLTLYFLDIFSVFASSVA